MNQEKEKEKEKGKKKDSALQKQSGSLILFGFQIWDSNSRLGPNPNWLPYLEFRFLIDCQYPTNIEQPQNHPRSVS